jgi:hypothetical protein
VFPSENDSFGLETPALDSGFNWTQVSLSKQKNNTLNWVPDASPSSAIKSVSLPGREYIATKTINTTDQAPKSPYELMLPYEMELKNRHWLSDTTFALEKYRIGLVSGTREGYARWGRIKMSSGQLRVINFSWGNDGQSSANTYPLTWYYRIFISDPLTPADLITRITKSK